MSMNLNSDTLRKIADALDEVSKAPYEVEQIRVAGHGVLLKRVTQSAGYTVVGITEGKFSGGHSGNCR